MVAKRVLFGALGGIALLLMLVTVMHLLSQLHLYQAEKFMAQWQVNQPASPQLIAEAKHALTQAKKRAVVTHPRIYQVSGLWHEWQGVWSSDPQQANLYYQQAFEDYQHQALAVPGWPYPWINQLRMIGLLASSPENHDTAFKHPGWQQAWQQSIYFAQRHSQVSHALAKELNLLWPLLNREEQQQALAVMVTSVSASPTQARQLMRSISDASFKAAVCLTIRAQRLNDYGQCS